MKRLVTIYPWPVHPVIAEALDAIGDLTVERALPGGPGPVLAIRQVPPFVCDAIVVHAPEKLEQAVDLVTGTGLELVSAGDIIGRTMGLEVHELTPEKVESKVRFR